MYTLHRPVYLKKSKPMAQCQYPTAKKQQSPPKEHPNGSPPSTSGPSTEETNFQITDLDDLHIPVLINHRGCMLVWPHEATRDVLTGRIPYYLADENGCTRYEAKHIFCALKLNRKDRDKYGEYPLVGGHERFLPKKEKKRSYSRRYISQGVGARGVYGRYADEYEHSREPLPPMTPSPRGSVGPRA